MGRKAGGKNFGNFEEPPRVIEITKPEGARLPDIFTCISKDFISVQDLMDASGLSYNTCAKIIREIKSISDIFSIAGCVHRTDYFLYISSRYRWKQLQEVEKN